MTSCPNATAPVNIVNNPELVCDLKCDYSFNYPNSSLNVTNRGEYLSLKTDAANNPPVTFNANKYDVTEMRIYQPSLHHYSGKKAAAELIIIHSGVSSQGNLLVCVPIVLGSSSTSNPESSNILDLIVSDVAKTANSKGKKTTVTIPIFSIDKLVPVKPYFSYTGTLPYSPCNGEYDYVVFSKDNDAFLSITALAYTSLKKVISANSYTNRKNSKGVFYNKNGPSNGTSGSGDLYMECLPTGSEGEALVPLVKSSEQLFNTETVKQFFINNSWIYKVLAGILIVFILVKIGSYLLKVKKASSPASASGGATTSAPVTKGGAIVKGGGYKLNRRLHR